MKSCYATVASRPSPRIPNPIQPRLLVQPPVSHKRIRRSGFRRALGPEVKLVMTLDLHSSLTDVNRRQVDLITVVKTYPYID